MQALRQVEAWPAGNVAVGVARGEEEVAVHGDRGRVFRLASVSKLFTAYACLVAAEEGTLDLDEPAGPPGSTVRHLLAHASGLPFEPGGAPIARPGRRRIYSNAGFETLGRLLAERAEMPFEEYVAKAVLRPLAIEPRWLDPLPASAGLHVALDELLRFARELLSPRLVAPETLAEAASVQFPGLAGVLPDVGRFDPLDWGLGFELKDGKEPHWTGRRTSPRTFGHFGGSGTFLWVDPEAGMALACLTEHGFGPWALQAWPRLSDAVVCGVSAGSDPVEKVLRPR